MRLKHVMAAAAAFAFCTVSFASLAVNAGEVKTINCSNASDLGLGDDSINAVRRNIYNVWGNSVEDIDANTPVSEYITVNFTISGIGSNSARKDTESTSKYDINGVNYVAFVGGSVAGVSRHSLSGQDATDEYITITGDGTYEATWTLADPSENISCLYLQTNIDFTDYVPEDQKETAAKEKNIALSGITLTVNSITTVEPDKEEDTTVADGEEDTTTVASEEDTTTTAAEGTTTAAGTTTTAASTTTTKAATTTAAAGVAATTAATTSSTVSNTPTGDHSGIAGAFAALAVAGAAAVVSKKKD